MAMGGVEGDGVDRPSDQRLDALFEIGTDPDGCRAAQAAGGIASGVRELLTLEDVFHRDQADQAIVGVDQRQLLDAVLLQDRLGLLQGGALRGGDQSGRGHELGDRSIEVGAGTEPGVAVGEDADQPPVVIGDRHAAELEPVHQRLGVVQRGGGRQGDRVGDHPALAALDLLHLGGLIVDRQVAMDDPDPALAGGGDRHSCLGDLVHGSRHDRHVEGDVGCEGRSGVDGVGQARRCSRGR